MAEIELDDCDNLTEKVIKSPIINYLTLYIFLLKLFISSTSQIQND